MDVKLSMDEKWIDKLASHYTPTRDNYRIYTRATEFQMAQIHNLNLGVKKLKVQS